MRNKLVIIALFAAPLASPLHALADETDTPVDELVDQAIMAVGGEEKLLDVFRFRERVLITSTPAPPVAGDEKGNRASVVKAGGGWWIGTNKRNKDKVRVLCWAWTLRILLDDKSKIEAIPDNVVDKKPAFGLRVTGSVKEPIDLFFDRESKRLTAIDYTDTRHVFSDWKKTKEGHLYPAHVAGFRFVDRKLRTVQEKQWYQTDILELVPLKELPSELK
ncbi:MAG: hypothetical protein QGF59_11215 [Pirellulaceae bacterium]|jgi:hypothetical protein|nr:hypothetical protein [Pirellulaceae bacterium]